MAGAGAGAGVGAGVTVAAEEPMMLTARRY